MNLIKITQRKHDLGVWHGDTFLMAHYIEVSTLPHGDVLTCWNGGNVVAEIYLTPHIHKIDVAECERDIFMSNDLAQRYALHLD